jgi:hypothetical protein
MISKKKSRKLIINNKEWRYVVVKKQDALLVIYTSPENYTSYFYTPYSDKFNDVTPKVVADHINRKIRLFYKNQTDWFSKEDFDLFKAHLLKNYTIGK